jgi:hypothetical protein
MPKFIKVHHVTKENTTIEIIQQVEYIMFVAPAKEEPESLVKSIIGTIKGDIGITETYEQMKELLGNLF